MKNKPHRNEGVIKLLIVTSILLLGVIACQSQSLIIHGSIKLDNESTLDMCTITISDDYLETSNTLHMVRSFNQELQYNKQYTITVNKEGYISKSIVINTACDLIESFKYRIEINLEKDESNNKSLCNAGGIFFNMNKNKFDYYLK